MEFDGGVDKGKGIKQRKQEKVEVLIRFKLR